MQRDERQEAAMLPPPARRPIRPSPSAGRRGRSMTNPIGATDKRGLLEGLASFCEEKARIAAG
jgi:hypothetical protein